MVLPWQLAQFLAERIARSTDSECIYFNYSQFVFLAEWLEERSRRAPVTLDLTSGVMTDCNYDTMFHEDEVQFIDLQNRSVQQSSIERDKTQDIANRVVRLLDRLVRQHGCLLVDDRVPRRFWFVGRRHFSSLFEVAMKNQKMPPAMDLVFECVNLGGRYSQEYFLMGYFNWKHISHWFVKNVDDLSFPRSHRAFARSVARMTTTHHYFTARYIGFHASMLLYVVSSSVLECMREMYPILFDKIVTFEVYLWTKELLEDSFEFNVQRNEKNQREPDRMNHDMTNNLFYFEVNNQYYNFDQKCRSPRFFETVPRNPVPLGLLVADIQKETNKHKESRFLDLIFCVAEIFRILINGVFSDPPKTEKNPAMQKLTTCESPSLTQGQDELTSLRGSWVGRQLCGPFFNRKSFSTLQYTAGVLFNTFAGGVDISLRRLGGPLGYVVVLPGANQQLNRSCTSPQSEMRKLYVCKKLASPPQSGSKKSIDATKENKTPSPSTVTNHRSAAFMEICNMTIVPGQFPKLRSEAQQIAWGSPLFAIDLSLSRSSCMDVMTTLDFYIHRFPFCSPEEFTVYLHSQCQSVCVYSKAKHRRQRVVMFVSVWMHYLNLGRQSTLMGGLLMRNYIIASRTMDAAGMATVAESLFALFNGEPIQLVFRPRTSGMVDVNTVTVESQTSRRQIDSWNLKSHSATDFCDRFLFHMKLFPFLLQVTEVAELILQASDNMVTDRLDDSDEAINWTTEDIFGGLRAFLAIGEDLIVPVCIAMDLLERFEEKGHTQVPDSLTEFFASYLKLLLETDELKFLRRPVYKPSSKSDGEELWLRIPAYYEHIWYEHSVDRLINIDDYDDQHLYRHGGSQNGEIPTGKTNTNGEFRQRHLRASSVPELNQQGIKVSTNLLRQRANLKRWPLGREDFLPYVRVPMTFIYYYAAFAFSGRREDKHRWTTLYFLSPRRFKECSKDLHCLLDYYSQSKRLQGLPSRPCHINRSDPTNTTSDPLPTELPPSSSPTTSPDSSGLNGLALVKKYLHCTMNSYHRHSCRRCSMSISCHCYSKSINLSSHCSVDKGDGFSLLDYLSTEGLLVAEEGDESKRDKEDGTDALYDLIKVVELQHVRDEMFCKQAGDVDLSQELQLMENFYAQHATQHYPLLEILAMPAICERSPIASSEKACKWWRCTEQILRNHDVTTALQSSEETESIWSYKNNLLMPFLRHVDVTSDFSNTLNHQGPFVGMGLEIPYAVVFAQISRCPTSGFQWSDNEL